MDLPSTQLYDAKLRPSILPSFTVDKTRPDKIDKKTNYIYSSSK